MVPLMVIYACAYCAWIYVQEPKSIKKVARLLSCPLWIYGLAWISLYFGPFRAAVFGGSAAVLILISLKVIGVEDIPTPADSVKGDPEGRSFGLLFSSLYVCFAPHRAKVNKGVKYRQLMDVFPS